MTHWSQGVFSPAAEHTHLDEEQENLGEGLGEGRAISGPDAISCQLGEPVELESGCCFPSISYISQDSPLWPILTRNIQETEFSVMSCNLAQRASYHAAILSGKEHYLGEA